MNQYDEMQSHEGLMLPLCNRIITTEISNDYTLPDYQPEVRRVLGVRENILPPAKYVSGDAVELNGAVDYTLLYVGADGEIYSAPLSAEYSANMPFANCRGLDRNEVMTVSASVETESVSARVTAPRKVTVRCRLNCHVRVWGKVFLEEEINGDVSAESIQRLCKDAGFVQVWEGISDIIEVSDDYETDGDIRVVSADADILIDDTSSNSDGVSVRGDIMLKLICADEGGEYRTVMRKLPFSEIVETDRAGKSAETRQVRGSIGNINVSIEEGKIATTVGFFLNASEESNMPFSYAADLYSTEKHCVCRYESVSVPVAKIAVDGNFSQSERIPVSDASIGEGAEVIDSCGAARVIGIEMTDGKCVLSGESRYDLICRKDGEIFSSEVRVPFKYEIETAEVLACERENADIFCSVMNCRVRTDGDILALDSEVMLSGVVFCEQEIVRVVEADMGDPIEREGSDIIICYSSACDTLWSVAKRYLVAPADVMGDPETDRYCIIQA